MSIKIFIFLINILIILIFIFNILIFAIILSIIFFKNHRNFALLHLLPLLCLPQASRVSVDQLRKLLQHTPAAAKSDGSHFVTYFFQILHFL